MFSRIDELYSPSEGASRKETVWPRIDCVLFLSTVYCILTVASSRIVISLHLHSVLCCLSIPLETAARPLRWSPAFSSGSRKQKRLRSCEFKGHMIFIGKYSRTNVG